MTHDVEERLTDGAKRKAQVVWADSPAGSTHAGGRQPGTREFFESVLERRSTYEIPWLVDVVPFDRFAGRRVLEVGCGAGYDAYAIARAGGAYVGIDITAENPVRTRQHLGLYGLSARVAQADAERLPFASASFDVAFSNGVLHHTPNLCAALAEIRRTLRPGGSAWIIVYHRDSLFYWLSLVLTDHILRGGYRRESLADRLARIEFNTLGEKPLVRVYSRRQLRRACQQAGLHVTRMRVRKLNPEDLPNLIGFRWLQAHAPRRPLTLLGRAFGWYLIAEASRPE